MRLGVVLEGLLDRTLDDALELLARIAPEATDVEVGVGGFAPAPHCDVALLLRDDDARIAWSRRIETSGFRVSALNVYGNPLHPEREIARTHDGGLPGWSAGRPDAAFRRRRLAAVPRRRVRAAVGGRGRPLLERPLGVRAAR